MSNLVDLWADPNDPFSANIDLRRSGQELLDPDAPFVPVTPAEIPPVVQPEVPPAGEELEPETEPIEVVPVAEERPKVYHLEDGSGEVHIEKDKEKNQWKGTAYSSFGAKPQVYWGKTKEELLVNVMQAQVHATKKIRQLNTELKLNSGSTSTAGRVPETSTRQLSADEKVEIRMEMDTDVEAAFEKLFVKKFGQTPESLAKQAAAGQQALYEQTLQGVNQQFRAEHPEYYPDDNGKNYQLLVQYMAKQSLGQSGKETAKNLDKTIYDLVAGGYYTAENLEQAFEDLSEDMIYAPKPTASQPTSTPSAEPRTETPPTDPRIVSVTRRPRAGLGLRPSDVSATPVPSSDKPPTVEDIASYANSLKDEDLEKLYHSSLAAARRQRS